MLPSFSYGLRRAVSAVRQPLCIPRFRKAPSQSFFSTQGKPLMRNYRSMPYSDRQEHGPACYTQPVEALRQQEYSHMNKGIYLDHSGATIYAQSAVRRFAEKMTSNLYGNPHSANQPAEESGAMVDAVRAKALAFLGADPAHFDLVFVANATAGIKLVADCFRDLASQTKARSFWYGYHADAHTSLVGVREVTGAPAGAAHCFESDAEVEDWLADPLHHRAFAGRAAALSGHGLGLFAYPGQSNLSGRRLPLAWPGRIRNPSAHALRNTYSILDAAALAMTSPMSRVFADPATAPDFTCLSFYKIFGFPDVGALIVRKDSGHILTLRRYFGGGTVTMVSTIGGAWHKSKGHETVTAVPTGDAHAGLDKSAAVVPAYELHDALEDGTLPFHSILALGEAIDVQGELFGGMTAVSRYTTRLAGRMYSHLAALRHPNGRPVCRVYSDGDGYGDAERQGATIAFNVMRADGSYVPYSEVEEAANRRGVYIRSGGVCCPGGLFTALQYEPWELDRARSAGHRCGSDGLSLVHQLPTGIVRASLGAMSTEADVEGLVTFLSETYCKEGRRNLSVVQEYPVHEQCAPAAAACSIG